MNFKTIKEVESHAKQLMNTEYRVEANGKVHWLTPSRIGYSFKFDNAKRRFGQCSYRRKEISLSKPLATKSIGCNGIRCYNSSEVNKIEHKYTLVCDTCGGKNPRHRKPRQKYSCAKCEPKKFNEKYLLKVVQNF